MSKEAQGCNTCKYQQDFLQMMKNPICIKCMQDASEKKIFTQYEGKLIDLDLNELNSGKECMVDNVDYDKIGKLTTNEAIEALKTYEKYACESSQMKGDNALLMAIQAMEKQIPKEPKEIRNMEFKGSNRPHYKSGDCPCCDTYVDTDDNPKFCPECGQALKW